MTALCRSRTKFGRCGLDAGHGGDMHAVPIGDDVWFGYQVNGGHSVRAGYGKFDADGFFRLLDSSPNN